ncbi:beta/gamma crystallin family protein [Skermanella mucosa]|uniref:beta/gamma crystallin family protein n=1 Tax=Skermanella mucosa TaxID=1789672 RepID=UPI00192B0C09|nr:beta/gamma crystallin family protein [Skermanella mucosa]UEM22759.1 beta/gamma crystallin family protein [Skermanella mucosa]
MTGSSSGQIKVYRDFNMQGQSLVINDACPDLRPTGLNDQISSFVVVSGAWIFYQDINYQSQVGRIYGPGSYPNVAQAGLPNDQISSLRCVNQITVYQDFNMQGKSLSITDACPDLRPTGLNDQISSFVVVSGTWTFYQDINYQTRVGRTYGPGVYPNVAQAGLPNDQISSLKSSV